MRWDAWTIITYAHLNVTSLIPARLYDDAADDSTQLRTTISLGGLTPSVIGDSSLGDWTLTIEDWETGVEEAGTIHSWTLVVDPGEMP